jgi:hypothetical protein
MIIIIIKVINAEKAMNITLRIVNMSCQHLDFLRKDYQLRCALAIVSSVEDTATVDYQQTLYVFNKDRQDHF